jgi:RHS repeat-associated protein
MKKRITSKSTHIAAALQSWLSPLLLLPFIVCLLAPLALPAQETMTVVQEMPGFKPESACLNYGNGESVNLNTGGLTIVRPTALGLPQNRGGNLRPTLVYNSKVASFAWDTNYPDITEPSHGFMGSGWSISYGRVFLRLGYFKNNGVCYPRALYFYQDESGAEHQLYRKGDVEPYDGQTHRPWNEWYVTNDSSFIRAFYSTSTNTWKIFFPDGSTRVAGGTAAGCFNEPIPAKGGTSTYWDHLINPRSNGWFVNSVQDRAGNYITIRYRAINNPTVAAGLAQPFGGSISSIEDHFSPSRTITFTVDTATALLLSVSIAGKTETFTYSSNNHPTLASVTDPMGHVTSFGYNYGPVNTTWPLLTQITYPTGGISSYTYAQHRFTACSHPANPDQIDCQEYDTEYVNQHDIQFRAVDPSVAQGSPVTDVNTVRWTYTRMHPWNYLLNRSTKCLPVLVKDPLGTQEAHFFSFDEDGSTSPEVTPGKEMAVYNYAPSALPFDPYNPLKGLIHISETFYNFDATTAARGDSRFCLYEHLDNSGNIVKTPVPKGNTRAYKVLESEYDGYYPSKLQWQIMNESSVWDGFGHYMLSKTTKTGGSVGKLVTPPVSAAMFSLKNDFPADGNATYQLDRMTISYSGGLTGAQAIENDGDPPPQTELPPDETWAGATTITGSFKAVTRTYGEPAGLLSQQRSMVAIFSSFVVDPNALTLTVPTTGTTDTLLGIAYVNGNITRLDYTGGDATGNSYGLNFTWDHGMVNSMWWGNATAPSPTTQSAGKYYELQRTIDAATSRITSHKDANLLETFFAYDGIGRITKITPPAGEYPTQIRYSQDLHTISTYRGSLGTMPSLTPGGSTATLDTQEAYSVYSFDGLGRLWRTDTVAPINNATDRWTTKSTAYDALGKAVFASEPYEYSAVSRGTCGQTTQNGAFILYLPKYGSTPLGTWTTIYATSSQTSPLSGTLDPHYRPRYTIRPDGSFTAFAYDKVTSTETNMIWNGTSNASSTTTYVKDLLGKLLTVQPAAGAGAGYAYDPLGNVTQIGLSATATYPPSASAQLRTFTYDALGHLLTANQPETGVVQYTNGSKGAYDAIGNLLKYTDAKSQTFTQAYDYKGRLSSVTQGGVVWLSNLYDTDRLGAAQGLSWGNVVESISANKYFTSVSASKTDRMVHTKYSYGGCGGRLGTQTQTLDFDAAHLNYKNFTSSYEYDCDLGALTGLTQADVLPGPRTWAYRHGAPVGAQLGGSLNVPNITYTASGAVAAMSIQAGSVNTAGLAMGRDFMSRINSISFAGGGISWNSGSFSYDPSQNIKQIGTNNKFGYDLANRLVAAQVEGHVSLVPSAATMIHNFSYQYDIYGNLTQRQEVKPTGYSNLAQYLTSRNETSNLDPSAYIASSNAQVAPKIPTGSTVTNNRINTVKRGETFNLPMLTCIYDANGNLTWDGSQFYEYDALNRLIATRNANSTTAPFKDQMVYDAAGERFLRVEQNPDPPDNPLISYTYSVRQGAQVLGELVVNKLDTVVEKRGYLAEGGRLVGRSTQVTSGYAPPSTGCFVPVSHQWLHIMAIAIGGQDVAVSTPTLSDPVWTPTKGGSHADLSYSIEGLADDVEWVEVRKSRLKKPDQTNCNGNSCEDQVEVQHMDRPEGGWAVMPIVFPDLQGDKLYRVQMTFASNPAGDLFFGARVMAGPQDDLICPKHGSVSAKKRYRWGEEDGPRVQISADAPQGYSVIGVTATGTVTLGTSVSGEDIVLDADATDVANSSQIQVIPPGDGGGVILPGICKGAGLVTWNTTYQLYATDHLGSVRGAYQVTGATLTPTALNDFEPYGVQLFGTPVAASGSLPFFTGQERDANTQNDNFHFRFYPSNLGMFMRPDNISGNPANPKTFNLYSYTNGNPVNFNDPSGHMYRTITRHSPVHGAPGTSYDPSLDEYLWGGAAYVRTVRYRVAYDQSGTVISMQYAGPCNGSLAPFSDTNHKVADWLEYVIGVPKDKVSDVLNKLQTAYNDTGAFELAMVIGANKMGDWIVLTGPATGPNHSTQSTDIDAVRDIAGSLGFSVKAAGHAHPFTGTTMSPFLSDEEKKKREGQKPGASDCDAYGYRIDQNRWVKSNPEANFVMTSGSIFAFTDPPLFTPSKPSDPIFFKRYAF